MTYQKLIAKLRLITTKVLREMKRREIKVEHLSQEAAESMLALHQNALVVWMIEKENAIEAAAQDN